MMDFSVVFGVGWERPVIKFHKAEPEESCLDDPLSRLPVGPMMAEAEGVAGSTGDQLQNDVAVLEGFTRRKGKIKVRSGRTERVKINLQVLIHKS